MSMISSHKVPLKTPDTLVKSPLVLDSGYHVPGGYTGRVPTGMGPGPNLFTCPETHTHEYPYPHIHASGKQLTT